MFERNPLTREELYLVGTVPYIIHHDNVDARGTGSQKVMNPQLERNIQVSFVHNILHLRLRELIGSFVDQQRGRIDVSFPRKWLL